MAGKLPQSSLLQGYRRITWELKSTHVKRMEMDKFFIYEMHRAIGTEGEDDIAKAARDAQRALYNFELTLRNYHNE